MKVSKLSKIALAVALAVPAIASAESSFVTGAATATGANARLDFRIVIPSVLYFRVGTSNLPALTNNATVDLVDFGTIATPGNSTPVAATSGGVLVDVRGNNGNISLTASHTGANGLYDGVGDYISMTTISATDGGNITHPTFVDNGTSGVVTILPNIGTKITNLSDTWTFSYANATIPAAGTYGGVNTNQGRVTYTVTMP